LEEKYLLWWCIRWLFKKYRIFWLSS
jgi:hypothetical protein